MPSPLIFSRLTPADLFAIERQDRQRELFGLPAEVDEATALQSCAQPQAWCARAGRSGRIVACLGILETFPGRQGMVWAILAEGIGTAHLALTRFVTGMIADCGLARVEAVARAPDIEADIAEIGGDPIVLAWRRATPEMRWAELCGMEAGHLLRQYGAAGETYMLFEVIRPALAAAAAETPGREAA